MYIFDSDFIIDFLRHKPNAIKKMEGLLDNDLATTALNVHEVLKGARQYSEEDCKKGQLFFQKLRVLPFTRQESQVSSQISALLQKEGREVDDFDILIASIVLAEGGILITNNKKHFERIPNLKIMGY